MLENMMDGYERALLSPKSQSEEKPECVRIVVRRAMNRSWKHLARERLRNLKPSIPRGGRFWPLSKDEEHAIKKTIRHRAGSTIGCVAEVSRQ